MSISRLLLRFSVCILVSLAWACGPGGDAPELQSIADQVVAVNQELVIVVNAADDDGDEVFYTYESDVPGIYSRATLNRLPVGSAEFRWTPEASDVGEWFFDFRASDGSLSDTVTIRIEVRAAIGGNSAPRFLHPQGSGTTLDLSVSECLNLDVEVVDSDSVSVFFGQGEPAIEGATLEQISGLAAEWSWCPTAEQIEQDDRYTLLLTADDEDNPKTLHPYLIVLRRESKPDCPGEPPVVMHTPSDVSSLLTLDIVAQVSDDQGLKREPLLYYSTTPPANPPELGAMVQVTMEPTSGGLGSGTFRARIPNPVASSAAGTSRTIYYVILADDDDDSEGSCDHITQSPATGVHSFKVTNPGGNGGAGVCEPCTADVQCGGSADHCVQVGSGSETFCMESCSGGCPTDYQCSASNLVSVDGSSSKQCVPISQDCSDPGGGQCNDDSLENNDSRTEASSNAALPPGTHNLVSCPASSGVGDDEDWFKVVVSSQGQFNAHLAGGSQSDLDLRLYDATGASVAGSTSLSSVEDISTCIAPGTYFLRVFAFGAKENPYTLSYSLSPQACQAQCLADSHENDDNASQATEVPIGFGPVEYTDRTLCSLDDDWYEVVLFNGETLGVEMTFDHTSTGDLDLHLYNANSVDLTPCSVSSFDTCDADNGQSGSDNELAFYEAPASGCPCTFYVVVQGFDGDENDYDIVFDLL